MTSLAIGVCTLGRPQMLAHLLRSIDRAQVPDGMKLAVIVVENAGTVTIDGVVSDCLSPALRAVSTVDCEPQRGIAQARNKVLSLALTQNFDWLAFVDDDEEVTPEWLPRLIAGVRQRGLQLAGGPVIPSSHATDLTWQERLILDGLRRFAVRGMKFNASLSTQGKDDGLSLCTNNWIVDLQAVRAHGLRFNEAFSLSGGEDMDFWEQAKAKGLKTGWVPDAQIWDLPPRSRLTFRYVIERNMNFAMERYDRRVRRGWPGAKPITLVKALLSLISLPVLLLATPFLRSEAVVLGTIAVGESIGRVRAVFGARSRLYERIHGQ